MTDVSTEAPVFVRGSTVLDYWLAHAEGLTVHPSGARVEEVVARAPVGRPETLDRSLAHDAAPDGDPGRLDRRRRAVVRAPVARRHRGKRLVADGSHAPHPSSSPERATPRPRRAAGASRSGQRGAAHRGGIALGALVAAPARGASGVATGRQAGRRGDAHGDGCPVARATHQRRRAHGWRGRGQVRSRNGGHPRPRCCAGSSRSRARRGARGHPQQSSARSTPRAAGSAPDEER